MEKNGKYLDYFTKLNICWWHTDIALQNESQLLESIQEMESRTTYGYNDANYINELKESSKKHFFYQYDQQCLISYVVMANSALEINFIEIAKYLLETCKFNLDIRNVFGSPIKKLVIVAGLCKAAAPNKETIQFFEDINSVRNIIIHSNGIVRNQNELKQMLGIIERNKFYDLKNKTVECHKDQLFEYQQQIRKNMEVLINLDKSIQKIESITHQI